MRFFGGHPVPQISTDIEFPGVGRTAGTAGTERIARIHRRERAKRVEGVVGSIVFEGVSDVREWEYL